MRVVQPFGHLRGRVERGPDRVAHRDGQPLFRAHRRVLPPPGRQPQPLELLHHGHVPPHRGHPQPAAARAPEPVARRRQRAVGGAFLVEVRNLDTGQTRGQPGVVLTEVAGGLGGQQTFRAGQQVFIPFPDISPGPLFGNMILRQHHYGENHGGGKRRPQFTMEPRPQHRMAGKAHEFHYGLRRPAAPFRLHDYLADNRVHVALQRANVFLVQLGIAHEPVGHGDVIGKQYLHARTGFRPARQLGQ